MMTISGQLGGKWNNFCFCFVLHVLPIDQSRPDDFIKFFVFSGLRPSVGPHSLTLSPHYMCLNYDHHSGDTFVYVFSVRSGPHWPHSFDVLPLSQIMSTDRPGPILSLALCQLANSSPNCFGERIGGPSIALHC